MDILSKLSERLKELMDEAEINTQSLSKEIAVDQSAIARVLRAARMPSLKTLVAFADFFHCSTDYLLGFISYDGTALEKFEYTDGIHTIKHSRGK